ncbi:Fruiting body protein SC3 [Grifola frondosa]|uniref:Hydrophobin n=1 Tax=Grifola frondosa TaxID=5627 RepID=A0A1C7MQT0_GRIFR|nr:Fruiting body protein SC3 [Grifola frondosa]
MGYLVGNFGKIDLHAAAQQAYNFEVLRSSGLNYSTLTVFSQSTRVRHLYHPYRHHLAMASVLSITVVNSAAISVYGDVVNFESAPLVAVLRTRILDVRTSSQTAPADITRTEMQRSLSPGARVMLRQSLQQTSLEHDRGDDRQGHHDCQGHHDGHRDRYRPASTESAGSCNVGSLQCCDSVESADSPEAIGLLGLLGIVVDGLDVLLGLNCSPLSIIGIGGGSCDANPVCCENNNVGGLISIGCIPSSSRGA